jgi:hypothetical protein
MLARGDVHDPVIEVASIAALKVYAGSMLLLTVPATHRVSLSCTWQ